MSGCQRREILAGFGGEDGGCWVAKRRLASFWGRASESWGVRRPGFPCEGWTMRFQRGEDRSAALAELSSDEVGGVVWFGR
ncbi:uncharacterized protein A4U43_C03F21990 [Asparagus officinalis]|uniref:Uncharacterized protein n=1 Tax=Asparagus officinalis TaxID=4686 RepID=A0A5P1FCU6_ASPOF|nr:uncharacterized protein A4U43_C03F21990 [Asparagus officinalis]